MRIAFLDAIEMKYQLGKDRNVMPRMSALTKVSESACDEPYRRTSRYKIGIELGGTVDIDYSAPPETKTREIARMKLSLCKMLYGEIEKELENVFRALRYDRDPEAAVDMVSEILTTIRQR